MIEAIVQVLKRRSKKHSQCERYHWSGARWTLYNLQCTIYVSCTWGIVHFEPQHIFHQTAKEFDCLSLRIETWTFNGERFIIGASFRVGRERRRRIRPCHCIAPRMSVRTFDSSTLIRWATEIRLAYTQFFWGLERESEMGIVLFRPGTSIEFSAPNQRAVCGRCPQSTDVTCRILEASFGKSAYARLDKIEQIN